MFSKFDSQINCEEVSNYEPTSADWEEYHNWLQDMEASTPTPEPEEEFRLSAPEGWDADDDSIGELSTSDSIEIEIWEDDYSDCDNEYYSDYDMMGELYDHD